LTRRLATRVSTGDSTKEDDMAESMPSVGDPAPEFKLQGIGGKEWSLADQKGKRNAVILFYVLDWTPG
jgi:peroxiredoxin